LFGERPLDLTLLFTVGIQYDADGSRGRRAADGGGADHLERIGGVLLPLLLIRRSPLDEVGGQARVTAPVVCQGMAGNGDLIAVLAAVVGARGLPPAADRQHQRHDHGNQEEAVHPQASLETTRPGAPAVALPERWGG